MDIRQIIAPNIIIKELKRGKKLSFISIVVSLLSLLVAVAAILIAIFK